MIIFGVIMVLLYIFKPEVLMNKRKKNKSSSNPYVPEGQQPYYPPVGPKISVYCASCNAPNSITRELFYHFTCNQCGNYFFNVGYFCRNCNQIYPISRDDFINLQEAETLSCNECNNVMKLLRSED